MIFGNHIRNQEKKLNRMITESQFQIFFLEMVYTLSIAQEIRISYQFELLSDIGFVDKTDNNTPHEVYSKRVSILNLNTVRIF